MIIIGIIFIVLAFISYLLAPASNEYVALIIIAGIFFLAAKMDSLYNKFINNYYRAGRNNIFPKAEQAADIKAACSDNSVAVTDNKPQETDSYEYLVWVILIIVVACFFVGIFFSRLYS